MNTLIAISGLGIFCLLAEIFNLRKLIVPISVVALLAILGITVMEYGTTQSYFNNMMIVTPFSTAFSSLFIILTVFIIAMSGNYYANKMNHISDFISIKIFMLAGGVAMVTFGNLAMFFVGIEILSISLYVLAGSDRLNIKSNEAGMKYFLMGAFASGIILFGICLVYGATGFFDIQEIHELSQGAALPSWFPIGITLLVIGMLFKIAAVPFHFWAPDVYEGSPTMVTATMSTLVKVIAVATLYKLLISLNATMDYNFEILIVVIAILSMTVGNIMALRQQNVKRMLAFSGVSHAGFMLMALLSINTSAPTLLYYTAAYALSGIAAFAVIIYVCKDKSDEAINNFNGLGKTHPIMAAVLTGSLLSMAGIPIFSGFFAKFMLFTQTIEAGYLIVVLAAVINSIISVGYYFKLILAMYTKESGSSVSTQSLFSVYSIVGIISITLNIIIGLYPTLITQWLA